MSNKRADALFSLIGLFFFAAVAAVGQILEIFEKKKKNACEK